MDIFDPLVEGIIEVAVTYPVLTSLWTSTFLMMPLVKETLITGRVLYELLIENDEDEYDEDDYDEAVYKHFNDNDKDD